MAENDKPKVSVDNIGKSYPPAPSTQASDVQKPQTAIQLSSLDKDKVETSSRKPPSTFKEEIVHEKF